MESTGFGVSALQVSQDQTAESVSTHYVFTYFSLTRLLHGHSNAALLRGWMDRMRKKTEEKWAQSGDGQLDTQM